jgi:glutamate carboxypeptidase
VSDFTESLNWIDSQRAAMRQRVIDWCNVNSYTHNLPGLERLGAEIATVLATLGPSIEWLILPPAESIDSRGQIVKQPLARALRARKRPEAKKRLFLGIHFDTVYPPDSPFQRVEQVDTNTLRGPGVIDAKGGLVVLLTALAALERSALAQNIGWEVILNPDEEIGSPGSAELFVEAAKQNHIGLVFEPAIGEGNLVDSRKGSGTFTIIVRGRAAHAGRDFAHGRNAIVALAAIVNKLHALNNSMNGIVVNVGQIEGGGAVNVVPDLAIARVNVRTTLPDDEAKLRTAFASILSEASAQDGINISFHGSLSSPPKVLDPKTKYLLDHILACSCELGLSISTQPSGGTSDGNKLAAAGLPVIDSMGPRGGKLHSPEEFLLVDSLAERAKLAAMVMLKFAAGELQF